MFCKVHDDSDLLCDNSGVASVSIAPTLGSLPASGTVYDTHIQELGSSDIGDEEFEYTITDLIPGTVSLIITATPTF